MKYLVDSDWVIDYLKGKSATVTQLQDMAREGLAINPITYGEVYEGIYFGKNQSHYMQVFNNFLDGAKLLALTTGVMQEFAYIRGNLRA